MMSSLVVHFTPARPAPAVTHRGSPPPWPAAELLFYAVPLLTWVVLLIYRGPALERPMNSLLIVSTLVLVGGAKFTFYTVSFVRSFRFTVLFISTLLLMMMSFLALTPLRQATPLFMQTSAVGLLTLRMLPTTRFLVSALFDGVERVTVCRCFVDVLVFDRVRPDAELVLSLLLPLLRLMVTLLNGVARVLGRTLLGVTALVYVGYVMLVVSAVVVVMVVRTFPRRPVTPAAFLLLAKLEFSWS